MSDFYLNATREDLIRALRSASAARGYDDVEATISLYLDVDKGARKSFGDYAEQWGVRSRTGQVSPSSLRQTRWPEITRRVWMRCTSDERQWTPQAARYIELCGIDPHVDPATIAKKNQWAMLSAETYRPDLATIAQLRATAASDSAQKPRINRAETEDFRAENPPNEPESQPVRAMSAHKPLNPAQHTNTSIPSSASISSSPPPAWDADSDPEYESHPAITAFRETFPDQRLSLYQREKIGIAVGADPGRVRVWRELTLERWGTNDYSSRNVFDLLARFGEDLREIAAAKKPPRRHARTATPTETTNGHAGAAGDAAYDPDELFVGGSGR